MSGTRDLGQIAPRSAVWMLCLGLSLASLTLLLHISLPPALLLLVCIAATWKGWRPSVPRQALKIGVFVGGMGLVLLTHGSLLGVEAGLSVLAILISLKLLEAHRPRDFHVLVLLGFFLCLTLLFFYQQLYVMLYVFVVVLILTASLVLSGAGAAMPRSKGMRLAARLLLQAVPLMVLLFLLFPRDLVGVRFSLRSSQMAQTGMSNQMLPGSIASLAESEELAFRVEFPAGEIPRTRDLYWRGGVLSRCFGLTWLPGRSALPLRGLPDSGGRQMLQRITMEPHGGYWVFALDRPITTPPGSALMTGQYLRSNRAKDRTSRYEVVSRPDDTEATLSREVQRQSLSVSKEVVSPRVQALVRQFSRGSTQDRVDAVLNYFQQQGFAYSLSPGQYGSDGLESFLFNRKVGFCEHYAGAFASLMRLANVPARVVIGYQGGEYNRHGGYMIVRQSHAHAWAEVFFDGTGWQRVDPTEAVAPGRISAGSMSFSQSGAESRDMDRADAAQADSAWRVSVREMRLAWDSLQFKWDSAVMDFGSETQNNLFELTGLGRPKTAMLLVWCAVATVSVCLFVGLILHLRRRTTREPLACIYQQLCEKGRKAGADVQPGEGPRDYLDRLQSAFPSTAHTLRNIQQSYLALRYGPEPQKYSMDTLKKTIRAVRLDTNIKPERL